MNPNLLITNYQELADVMQDSSKSDLDRLKVRKNTVLAELESAHMLIWQLANCKSVLNHDHVMFFRKILKRAREEDNDNQLIHSSIQTIPSFSNLLLHKFFHCFPNLGSAKTHNLSS